MANTIKPGDVRIWHHEINKQKMEIDKNETLSTHLPILTINTNNQDLSDDEDNTQTVLSEINIYDNNKLSDNPKIKSNAQVKYRGRSSMHFDKKGYELEIRRM